MNYSLNKVETDILLWDSFQLMMDLEAMQILNLSPIPELSEIELSTMLEQLSGLSDINGDLTDRNVEDIIKEAEDLLDRSTSSKPLEFGSPQKEQNSLADICTVKDQELNSQTSDLEENKQQTLSSNSNSHVNASSEPDSNQHFNSPVETSSVIYSPGSSSNPIKSTIDSLKEFSSFIEKKLASQSPKSSPKHVETVQNNQVESTEKKITSSINKKSCNVGLVSNNSEIIETPKTISKKSDPLDKSIKLLNCFERLYRDKPVRLSTKKSKVVDKLPKTIVKKKLCKDLKNNKKNNWQGKNLEKKISRVDVSASNSHCFHQTSCDFVNVSKPKKAISEYHVVNDDRCWMQNGSGEPMQENSSRKNVCNGKLQSRISEKRMTKVLSGPVETKGAAKKTKDEQVTKDTEIPNVILEKIISEPEETTGIKRLEEQFCILKDKYNYQIDKLEAENLKLREALNRQQKTLTSKEKTIPNSPVPRTFSSENCKAPKNSPCSSSSDVLSSTTVKEASSQTEKDLKNTSVQCSQDFREVGTETTPEAKKAENKENVVSKKKSKLFSDVNVHQSIRQKKAIEHETQLLATLRGLQAEVGDKDKENRKLKNEIESLKKQMKKLGNVKVENGRRCNIGTQTIGLGTLVQKPYNPENYEVPDEFEKENEDLRSRIKALEEDFELLKEKRITDLQSLHQVHEEEMAKLVSKLETQSALTKHLHSLLVNR